MWLLHSSIISQSFFSLVTFIDSILTKALKLATSSCSDIYLAGFASSAFHYLGT